MNEAVKSFIDNKAADMRETLRTLALIPAPSGMERERARFCADFLRNAGAAEVRRDRVGNLICPLRPGRSGKWIVFSAHMDTSFPLRPRFPSRKRVTAGSVPASGMIRPVW